MTRQSPTNIQFVTKIVSFQTLSSISTSGIDFPWISTISHFLARVSIRGQLERLRAHRRLEQAMFSP